MTKVPEAANRADVESKMRELGKLAKKRVLILDDFGLEVLDTASRLFLLEVLEDRHGRASTILGEAQINIAGMQVGRIRQGEEAIMVLNVDSEVPPEVMEEIRQKVGIFTAKSAKI